MKFAEIIALLEAGKFVGSPSLFGDGEYLGMDEASGDIGVYNDSGGFVDDVTLNGEYLGAADYYEFTAPNNPEMWGYFHQEKGRWMSTSNPEKQRAAGIEVKRFTVSDEA